MDANPIKKVLLRGGPPIIVVALMLYYTFYVGGNADKLYKEKDRLRQEQPQTQAADEKNADSVQGKTALPEEEAVSLQEPSADHKAPAFEKVFAAEFWREKEPLQWQRQFLGFADEVGNGFIPARTCGGLRSEVGFTAEMRNGEWRVSRQCANRYAKYVDLICDIDSAGVLALFFSMRNALDAMLTEMGFVEMDSVTLTRQALAAFRDMPVPAEDPAMLKGDGDIFFWKDSKLEKLSPIRKFCLRMGVANARRLKSKAADISAMMEARLAEEKHKR